MGIQVNYEERSTVPVTEDIHGFREELVKGLKELCGPEFSVERRDVEKNNGVILHGISIMAENENVAPTIYVEQLYGEYQKGTISIREAENEIIRLYSGEMKNRCFIDTSEFAELEKAKEKIIFRVVNSERNRDFLSEVPHRNFLDLTVIYTVYVEGMFSGAGNVIIKNELMESWGIGEKDLFKYAVKNTPAIKKPVMRDLCEMIISLLKDTDGENEMLAEELKNGSGMEMYILTNSDKYYGGSIVLYPGFLKEVREKIGGDYYLLPSSVHEFIVVPCGNGRMTGELSEMVQSVNRTSVGREDYLSDSVYIFKDGRMSICS